MKRLKQAYVKSFDDTDIYYESMGEGLPIILLDGIGCFGFVWKYFTEYFSSTNRFVHIHYRGHGKSSLPDDENNLSIQDICRDIKAALDDDGVKSGVFMGHSMGVQVIFEFAKMYPNMIKGLVPVCGSYGHPLRTFRDMSFLDKIFPLLYVPGVLTPWAFSPFWKGLLPTRLAWEIAIRTDVNGHLLKRDDLMQYFYDLSSVPLRIFIKMLDHAARHSAEEFLPEITVPTMIIAGENDTFTPRWLSDRMKDLIPNSEIMIIPHGTHTAPIEMPQLFNLRIEKWLRKQFSQLPPDEPKEKAEKSPPRKTRKKRKSSVN